MNVTDNNQINKIAGLEREAIALKSQQFSGSGNIYSYITETTNTWDLNVPSTSATKSGQLEMLFTSTNKPAAYTSFQVTILVNGQHFYTIPPDSLTVDIRSAYYGQKSADRYVAEYQQTAVIPFAVPPNNTLQIKARAVSVDTGTLQTNVIFN